MLIHADGPHSQKPPLVKAFQEDPFTYGARYKLAGSVRHITDHSPWGPVQRVVIGDIRV